MKLTKLSPLALAMTIAAGGVAAPVAVNAELSANIGISNMYLWRGLNLTPDGPQVHGGLQYDHDSGAYGGVWTTNETGGSETDLYVGFAGEAGDFSYDVSYWQYLYPEDDDFGGGAVNVSLRDNDIQDLVVALGFGPATLTVYNYQGDDSKYITLGFEHGKYSATYGVWDLDAPSGTVNDYSHLTLSYAATDDLSVGISIAKNDVDDHSGSPGNDFASGDPVETDPLFFISYNIPVDLK